jgi:putative addiction module component (TIGR02574 family)
MSNLQIIEEALLLNPQDKFLIIDALLKSLDKPDAELNSVWENESEKRLQSYKNDKTQTISFEEVFNL